MNDPFFIVSNPRSGSTLLASILNRHSRLAIPPETHFLTVTWFQRHLPKAAVRRNPEQALAAMLEKNIRLQDVRVFPDDILAAIGKDPVDYASSFRQILDIYAKRQGKSRAGEKTPTHLQYSPVVFRWYPDAKIICIIRDGRDVVASLERVPWTHSHILRHAAEWAWSVREALSLEQQFPGRFLVVRFEDLLSSPDNVLQKVCALIGEEFEPGMVSARGGSDHIPDWEEAWKLDAAGTIDTSKLNRWQNNQDAPSVRAVEILAKDELVAAGYDLSAAADSERHDAMGLRSIIYRRAVYDRLFRPLAQLFRRIVPRRGYRVREVEASK